MTAALFIGLSYLIGATPTSYWVGRALGVDLREVGSGNLGATNTFRALGMKAAFPVAAIDVFKGWLPVWWFHRVDGLDPWLWALAYGAAAILGHVFSFWVGFRGGKGVATSAGVFTGIAPGAALIAVASWIVVTFSTRIVSLGSLAAAAVIPVAVQFTPHRGGRATVGFAILLSLFVFWAHRANIRRLMRGEENRFGKGPGRGTPSPGREAPGTNRGAPDPGADAAGKGGAARG